VVGCLQRILRILAFTLSEMEELCRDLSRGVTRFNLHLKGQLRFLCCEKIQELRGSFNIHGRNNGPEEVVRF
jgi:hypothetical protein